MSSKALSFMKRDIVIGEILDCVPSSSALKWSNLMTQFFFHCVGATAMNFNLLPQIYNSLRAMNH